MWITCFDHLMIEVDVVDFLINLDDELIRIGAPAGITLFQCALHHLQDSWILHTGGISHQQGQN